MRKILLVEPEYRCKYPPLGLMKIATYHQLLGDAVVFHRGTSAMVRDSGWDRIYIATLFTFQWRSTVETIRFYARGKAPVIVGGILATLLPADLENATGVKAHTGPITQQVEDVVVNHEAMAAIRGDIEQRGIDALPPDYGIFQDMDVPYRDTLDQCYVLRSSKGCTRGCAFCAVPQLEPEVVERIRLTPTVEYIAENWGEKRNLLLLDDNTLLSPQFDNIVDEIADIGFGRGSRLGGKLRWVDFNQGLDVRLLTSAHIRRLSKIALRPIRLAFDDTRLADIYSRLLREVHGAGFGEISTYVLYNHEDTPSDLYHRLEIACDLNSSLGSRVYSFPMKYIPCDAKDRTHLGKHWNRRQIRGVQCILNASHGIAPRDPAFFRKAFGRTTQEFLRIIQMPEDYIIKRSQADMAERIRDWNTCWDVMSSGERDEALSAISEGKGNTSAAGSSVQVSRFLKHYSTELAFARNGTQ